MITTLVVVSVRIISLTHLSTLSTTTVSIRTVRIARRSRNTVCNFGVLRVTAIHTVMSVRMTIHVVCGVRVRSMRGMSGITRNGTLTTASLSTTVTTPVLTSLPTLPTFSTTYTITCRETSSGASTSVVTVTTRPTMRTTRRVVSVNITTSQAYFATRRAGPCSVIVSERATAGSEAAARGVAQGGFACA